ncbi:hypothetical protein [Fusibacter ferrireducens]|uniref:Uncharacterized protein n=1 Tax=Fusibacter ferrireducens TaxID=2785058 RepID=A0ABR9ZNF1_9FIRM|nr:hypothetical protein [Fusibacter ferrireducens]MBF4691964.1 hypothetical protein [Fusibacter ferrireducens]
MAIILEHRITREKYILLGAGLGMFRSSRPGVFAGNLNPVVEEGREEVISVCDIEGEIIFIDRAELKVIEVDGKKINEITGLSKSKLSVDTDSNYYKCPGCGGDVTIYDDECNYCALRLK